MKKLIFPIMVALLIIVAGCSSEIITKYQCYDKSVVDSYSECPEIEPEIITKIQCSDGSVVDTIVSCLTPEIKVVEKEIMKYQCNNGDITDDPSNCPATEVVDVLKTSDYDSSKHYINRKQTKGVFEVTVKYAGFDGNDYKVEFEVRNRGSESEYFQPNAIAILDSELNQYEVGYSSKYKISTMSNTILSGVTKEGFWLFEDIPVNSGIGEFTFEIGFTDKDRFSFDVPLN